MHFYAGQEKKIEIQLPNGPVHFSGQMHDKIDNLYC